MLLLAGVTPTPGVSGVPKWSPGIREVVQMLHKQGTDVAGL